MFNWLIKPKIIKGLEEHRTAITSRIGDRWHCSNGTYEVVSIDEETRLPNWKALDEHDTRR